MDNLFLYNASGALPPAAGGMGGSPGDAATWPVNLGSWLEKSAGVDFGTAGLIRQEFTTNPYIDTPRFSREDRSQPRTMRIPVIIPSGGMIDGNGLPETLDGVEGALRRMVRPGGFIEIAVGAQASLAYPTAVRFDIIGGQVTHRDYSPDLQRNAKRRLMVELTTQPFGYWPTYINMINGASVSMSAGSRTAFQGIGLDGIIGDVPGICDITVTPTVATQTGSSASYGAGITNFAVDGFAWAFDGRPSFTSLLGGGSWLDYTYTASMRPASAANAGQPPISGTAAAYSILPGSYGFDTILGYYLITDQLAAVYAGRYRCFAALFDTAGRPHQIMLDACMTPAGLSISAGALGSANSIATMVPSAIDGWGLYDLGELTLPPLGIPSGTPSQNVLRIWATRASSAATSTLFSNGLFLLPLSGRSGIVTRGLAHPSIGSPTTGQVQLGAVLHTTNGVYNAGGDLRQFYNGQMPLAGGSGGFQTNQSLHLLPFQRIMGAASMAAPPLMGTRAFASVTVRYQPRFTFQRYVT